MTEFKQIKIDHKPHRQASASRQASQGWNIAASEAQAPPSLLAVWAFTCRSALAPFFSTEPKSPAVHAIQTLGPLGPSSPFASD